MNASTKRAVLYLRQSLDRTGEQAGVKRQEEACRALATARGWTVEHVLTDNSVSASKGTDRPAWTEVLSLIDSGAVDVVVAYHVDRITRTMTDLEKLILLAESNGVGIATVNGDLDLTNDTGRMVARILAAVARAEVERKAARQVLANEQKAASGGRMWSRKAYGYNMDGSVCEAEAEYVREAYDDVLTGIPLEAIVRRWNGHGVPTVTGSRWTSTTLRQVLLNARNAGIVVYKGDEIGPGEWEAIVPEATYRAAVRTLTAPGRFKGNGGAMRKYLLSGIVKCGVCGASLKSQTRARGAGKTGYVVYQCSTPSGCTSAKVDELDSHVSIAIVEQWRQAPDFREAWNLDKAQPADVEALEGEAESLRGKLDEISEDYANDIITRAQRISETARVRERLEQVEKGLAVVHGRSPMRDMPADPLEAHEWFLGLEQDVKRAIISEMTEAITLDRGRKGARVFDPYRLRIVWRMTD